MNNLINNSIDKIILVNSASYAFFEMDTNKNLILEGNNNEGKTSVLNTLQLLLLPENNLRDINNKFRFKPGKDKNDYTKEETYQYYFSDQNSFILFQVTNKFKTFTILLHGVKQTTTEYNRIIIPAPFKDIKKLFVDEEEELINLDYKKMILQLKEKYTNGFKQLSKTEDIKKWLFEPTRNSEYNIVPLRNINNDTLGSYKVLLKSLYDVSSMTTVKKKQLIADIISNRQQINNDKNKKISMDITSIKKEYQELKKEQVYLEKLKSFEEDFFKVKDVIEMSEIKEQELLKDFVNLFISIKKEQVSNNDFLRKYEEKSLEIRNKIKLVEEEKEEIIKKLTTVDVDIKRKDSEFNKATFDFNKIKDNFSIEDFNKMDINKIREEKLEYCNNQIKIYKKENIDLKKSMEELKNLDELEKIQSELKNNIKKQNIILDKKTQELENIDILFINSEEFSDTERSIMKEVFSDTILTLNKNIFNNNLTNDFKNFLKLFEIKNKKILLNETEITNDYKERKNIKDILISDIEDLSKYIIQTKDKLSNIEEEISFILKDKDRKNELIKKIKNNEIIISKLEVNKSIWYQIDNIIKTLNEYNKDMSVLKQKQKLLSNDLIDTENNKKRLSQEANDIKKNMSSISKDLSENDKILLELEEDEEIEEFIPNNYNLNNYINNYINTDEIQNNIEDFYSTFQILKEEKRKYLNSKYIVSKTFLKMINENLLEELSEDVKSNIDNLYGQKIILNYLNDKYSMLKVNEEELNSNMKTFGQETHRAIELLKMAKSFIKNFENDVNNNFKKVQISNLKGVKIEITLNKKLLSIIDRFDAEIKNHELNYLDNIEEVNNYLLENTSNKNEIQIIDLIDNVTTKILQDIKTIDGEEKEITTTTNQSNGTEMMIMLVFVSMLLRSVYKEGYNLKMPIIIDEVSNIDINNIESLLSLINNLDLIVVAATPNTSPDFRLHFNVVMVDARQAKTILNIDRKPIRKYIVSPKTNPLFIIDEKENNFVNEDNIKDDNIQSKKEIDF